MVVIWYNRHFPWCHDDQLYTSPLLVLSFPGSTTECDPSGVPRNHNETSSLQDVDRFESVLLTLSKTDKRLYLYQRPKC